MRRLSLEHKAGEVSLNHCPACGLAVVAEDSPIRIHGHYYHHGCATYRPRQADGRVAGAGGAEEQDG